MHCDICGHTKCDPNEGCRHYTSEDGFCGCLGQNHKREMELEDHAQGTCLCGFGDGDLCPVASGPLPRHCQD